MAYLTGELSWLYPDLALHAAKEQALHPAKPAIPCWRRPSQSYTVSPLSDWMIFCCVVRPGTCWRMRSSPKGEHIHNPLPVRPLIGGIRRRLTARVHGVRQLPDAPGHRQPCIPLLANAAPIRAFGCCGGLRCFLGHLQRRQRRGWSR